MNNRNTAGKLGFIKDSEGVYRKGNFIFKNGKIMRESAIVPEGTIKDLKDDFVTADECIRSVLAYSTLIGDTNPRATNVYIDKVGNNYKPSNKLSKNTVAVVMSNRQVMDIKPRDIPEQDDNKKLENKDKEDKPAKAKAIKDFSKPTEFSKLKKESVIKKAGKLKLKESSYDDDFVSIEKLSEKVEQLNAIIELMRDNGLDRAHCEYNMPYCDCISFAGVGYIALTDDVYDADSTLPYLMDESCGKKVGKSRKLKESKEEYDSGLADEAYEVADYIDKRCGSDLQELPNGDRVLRRDDFDELFIHACERVFGITDKDKDSFWSGDALKNRFKDNKYSGASDVNELENTVRGILSHEGYETVFENTDDGADEGDLVIRN